MSCFDLTFQFQMFNKTMLKIQSVITCFTGTIWSPNPRHNRTHEAYVGTVAKLRQRYEAIGAVRDSYHQTTAAISALVIIPNTSQTWHPPKGNHNLEAHALFIVCCRLITSQLNTATLKVDLSTLTLMEDLELVRNAPTTYTSDNEHCPTVITCNTEIVLLCYNSSHVCYRPMSKQRYLSLKIFLVPTSQMKG